MSDNNNNDKVRPVSKKYRAKTKTAGRALPVGKGGLERAREWG